MLPGVPGMAVPTAAVKRKQPEAGFGPPWQIPQRDGPGDEADPASGAGAAGGAGEGTNAVAAALPSEPDSFAEENR